MNQYVSRPTEWIDFTKSDVLYTASSAQHDKTLPPLLVEIQYTANMAFYRRLIKYGLSTMKQHSASPVVLVIVIHNITTEVVDLLISSKKQPYLFELPCHGWAKSCYVLNASSISAHISQTVLNPLVALGHFLIQQKLSLRHIDRNDDATIQLLYAIAKELFGDDSQNGPKTADVLQQIHDQCTMAKTVLCEDVSNISSQKRTLACLDQVLHIINQQESTTASAIGTSDSGSADWQFVEKYHNDHGAFNWQTIFELGKAKNLFKSYSKWTSAKSAYYRQKKQRH